jgi:hypothetical protein
MRLALLALALTLPAAPLAQGAPHPALTRLIPLTEVYDARAGRAAPGFDVAGIRCGAMVQAQDIWARETPGIPRVAAVELRDADSNLTAAEVDRRQRLRMGAAAAASTTRADAERVRALYLARFEENRRRGLHPWRGDTVLDRDTTYCGFLNQR